MNKFSIFSHSKLRKLFFLIILLTVVFATKGPAIAKMEGEGLTISPPLFELKLKPGQTVEEIIRVTNPTDKIVEVYPKAMDFKAKGEGGEPEFYYTAEDNAKFSIANWISFEQTKLALTPEQIIEFRYKITVPTDAEPGGHYGAVFFVSEPPEDEEPGARVSIGSMIGSLILANLPGTEVEKGFLEQFSSDKNIYLNSVKSNLTTKIANIGNVHFKPKGKISIKNTFGHEVANIPFNDQGGNVLPDSTRKFSDTWSYKWSTLGKFTADLSLVYGDNEKTLSAKFDIWIIPWWFILAFTSTLVLMLFLIWRIIKRRKRPIRRI